MRKQLAAASTLSVGKENRKEVLPPSSESKPQLEARRSRIVWDNLEERAPRKVQELVQSPLDEEIKELLGRQKSARHKLVDSPTVCRNGYGKARKLTLGCGTVAVHRPMVRGLEQLLESQVLPLLARRTPKR